MDFQALIDAINTASKNTRSDYQMTLGKLIEELEKVENKELQVIAVNQDNKEDILMVDNGVDSYRGYYSDFAIEYVYDPDEVCATTVAQLLPVLKNSVGETFVGYKGGDFLMDENTPVWMANYGSCPGLAVMSVTVDEEAVIFNFKKID